MTASRSSRTCSATGLRLVPAQGQRVYRITKPSFGPLNPLLRPGNPSEVDSWGRWDVPAGRTVYATSTVEIAYRELLAYVAASPGVRDTKLANIFDDVPADDPRTLLDAITEDWEHICHFEPRKLVRGWREQRQLYVLTAPASGWMVDVEHHDTLDALNRGLGQILTKTGFGRLTRGHLLGEDRRLTVLAAMWVRGRVLDDGNLPHGIQFSSKHGRDGRCWALWLRRVDDGHEVSTEPTKVASAHAIDPPDRNPTLRSAAEAFGLTLY